MTEGVLTTFLGNVTEMFGSAVQWTSGVLELVVSEPVAFVMVVGTGLVGLGFGLAGRLIHL